jgi:hypothetical protein
VDIFKHTAKKIRKLNYLEVSKRRGHIFFE